MQSDWADVAVAAVGALSRCFDRLRLPKFCGVHDRDRCDHGRCARGRKGRSWCCLSAVIDDDDGTEQRKKTSSGVQWSRRVIEARIEEVEHSNDANHESGFENRELHTTRYTAKEEQGKLSVLRLDVREDLTAKSKDGQ